MKASLRTWVGLGAGSAALFVIAIAGRLGTVFQFVLVVAVLVMAFCCGLPFLFGMPAQTSRKARGLLGLAVLFSGMGFFVAVGVFIDQILVGPFAALEVAALNSLVHGIGELPD